MAKIARITNLTEFYTWKGKGQGESRSIAKWHKLARVTRIGKNC